MMSGISPAAQSFQVPHGTAFPANPLVNDHFIRDDIGSGGMEFACVSVGPSVWHSAQVFSGSYTNTFPATQSVRIPAPLHQQGMSIYVEELEVGTRVPSTNDASNYFTIQPATEAGPTPSNLNAITTASDTVNVLTDHSQAINAVYTPGGLTDVLLTVTKVLSPGTLVLQAVLRYRLVGPA
jgi:hypothetical protein